VFVTVGAAKVVEQGVTCLRRGGTNAPGVVGEVDGDDPEGLPRWRHPDDDESFGRADSEILDLERRVS
jgi:hypothetical protein